MARSRLRRALLALAIAGALAIALGAGGAVFLRSRCRVLDLPGKVTALAFAPSGELVVGRDEASPEEHWLEVWRLEPETRVWRLRVADAPSTIGVSSDGDVVVWEPMFRACSFRDGTPLERTIVFPRARDLIPGAWSFVSPELGLIARRSPTTVDLARTIETDAGAVRPVGLWTSGIAWSFEIGSDHFVRHDLRSGSVTRVPAPLPSRTPRPYASNTGLVAPRGDVAVAANPGGLVALSLDDGESFVREPIEGDKIRAAYLSPDGDWCAIGRVDGVTVVWSIRRRGFKADLVAREGGSVLDLAFSPDGDTLATVQADGKVRLWPLARLR